MAQDDNQLKGELRQFSRDDWLALLRKTLPGSDVEMELSTTTYDGLTIQPLYTLQDDPGAGHAGIPGGAPFTRGRLTSPAEPPWDVRQLFTEPDIDAANQAIGEDLSQGVTSILLRIATSEQCGIQVHTADEMKRLLDGTDVSSVPVALQAGMRCFEIAEIFLKAANELGADANRMPGALNIDPIGTLAQRGVLDINLEQALAGLARIFEQTADRPATFSILLADGRPYHNAGATEAQEIACAAATIVAYLRACDGLDVPPETVLERLAVMLAADTDQFLTIAKFRALRHVVWRIAEACGAGNAARALPVAAQTSERMMAGRDVHVNMLRTTIACAAAIQGGADAITVLPFTWPLGLPDAFARRIARNTHAVLRDEAAMGRVSDPAGGS